MIKLVKPYISFEEVELEFREVFKTGAFTRGPFVDEFSKSIKQFVGSEYCVLTSSATTALSVCLRILGVGPGDEVLCSDFSFPATANVIEDIGAKPIFVDVSIETFNMNVEDFKSKLNSKTKAVIFVDALGNPSGISEIKDLCTKNGVPLIEDAACAIGSAEGGIKVGNIADLTCFSFHPRKLLTTGEGGAITTNSAKYFESLQVKLLHGAKPQNEMMDFVDFGYNYRLPDLQCIMGLKQIRKIPEIIKERNEIRNLYIQLLHPLGFNAQKVNENVTYNVQSLVFRLPSGFSRKSLSKNLKENGIESTLGTYSMSSTTYYSEKYKSIQKTSSFLQENTITLPCYSEVDVNFICNKISEWCRAQ